MASSETRKRLIWAVPIALAAGIPASLLSIMIFSNSERGGFGFVTAVLSLPFFLLSRVLSHGGSSADVSAFLIEPFGGLLPLFPICQFAYYYAMALAALSLYDRRRRANAPDPKTVCRDCGYSLYGLRDPWCPECGCTFDPMLLYELNPKRVDDTDSSEQDSPSRHH